MSLIVDTFHRVITLPDDNQWRIIGASVLASLTILKISQLALKRTEEKLIPGPGTTLIPRISEDDKEALPYPPDALPGGRFVKSPYGTIRVYEWGPEDGRKVLLVHGITTPCIALGAVARRLVEKGCRVMLFDLWGRGYTDSCADLKHDDRLYSSEILIVLASSKLSWIGGPDGGFDLIGYSLGGGIATSFASYFSSMVRSLILLAPSGIIRPEHMNAHSRVLYYTGLVPESFMLWMCKKRLLAGPMYAKENKEIDITDAFNAEVQGDGHPNTGFMPLSQKRPDITVVQAVQWQLRNHDGFVHSFLSSIRFAPITAQQENWRRLKAARDDEVLLITGTRDPIIFPSEVREDAEELLGKDRVAFVELDSTHDFPITDSRDVVSAIFVFWKS